MSNPNRTDYFFINENDVDARELVIAEGIIKRIRDMLMVVAKLPEVSRQTLERLDTAALVQDIRNETPFRKTGVAAIMYRTAEDVAPPEFDTQLATVHVPMGGRPFTVPTEVAEEMNRLRAVILNKEMQLSGIRANEEISRWPQWKQDIAGVKNPQVTSAKMDNLSRLINWCGAHCPPMPRDALHDAHNTVSLLRDIHCPGSAGDSHEPAPQDTPNGTSNTLADGSRHTIVSGVSGTGRPKGTDMWDAYEGARLDLLIWKRRALEAEDTNRNLLVWKRRALEAEDALRHLLPKQPQPQPESQRPSVGTVTPYGFYDHAGTFHPFAQCACGE